MRIKGAQINNEMIAEIGKFTVLMAWIEREMLDYGRAKDLETSAYGISAGQTTKELAEALQGRIDLYGSDIGGYTAYILEDATKADQRGLWNNTKRKKVEDFINLKGQDSIEGGLLAIYRIRNNLFHGIKELKQLNNQLELFRAMNKFLEELA